jgi:hypothetical protein
MAYRNTFASRKSRVTARLEFFLERPPVGQFGLWQAEEELGSPSSAATVLGVQILRTCGITHEIGNRNPAASREALERCELARLHEDLHTFGLGHPPIMHMHMSIRLASVHDKYSINYL